MPVECASPVIPPVRLSLGIEGRLAPRLNREQPRQNSGARPLIVSSLSPRSFYGEASSTIATPYTYNDDLRRDPGESPGPQGGGTWFQRETSSLSWSRGYQRELSPSVHCSRRAQKRSRARFRANTLSVTLRPSPRSPERKTRFHARNCLVTRSRFVMPPYG